MLTCCLFCTSVEEMDIRFPPEARHYTGRICKFDRSKHLDWRDVVVDRHVLKLNPTLVCRNKFLPTEVPCSGLLSSRRHERG